MSTKAKELGRKKAQKAQDVFNYPVPWMMT